MENGQEMLVVTARRMGDGGDSLLSAKKPILTLWKKNKPQRANHIDLFDHFKQKTYIRQENRCCQHVAPVRAAPSGENLGQTQH